MSRISTQSTIFDNIVNKIRRVRGNHWYWTGTRNSNGTPVVGATGIGSQLMQVNRALWKIRHGRIPPKHYLFATCGHKECMNPNHMDMTNDRSVAQNFHKIDKRMVKAYQYMLKLGR